MVQAKKALDLNLKLIMTAQPVEEVQSEHVLA